MEFDNTRKLQLAFILVMFGAASWFVYSRWDDIIGKPKDDTVVVFQEMRRVPIDPKKPISSSNPVDPKKSPLVATFACSDGKLEVSQYPPSTGLMPRLKFIADVRRGANNMLRHENTPLDEIPDACKRAIVHSARNVAAGRGAPIAGELERDQRAKEKDIRQKLTQALATIQDNAADGSLAPDVYKKFLDALEKFNANTADMAKDSAKQALAREVIRDGLEYVAKIEAVRENAMDQYVTAVNNLLLPEQRERVSDLGNRLINRQQASSR